MWRNLHSDPLITNEIFVCFYISYKIEIEKTEQYARSIGGSLRITMGRNLEQVVLAHSKPGKYILYDRIQKLFPDENRRALTKEIKSAIKNLVKKGLAAKGYGGMYYLVSQDGTTPFYSKELKISKWRMAHLKNKDISKKGGPKAIAILKAKSEDVSFNFYNYKEKRAIKNKLVGKKCRICGAPSYCMHHILPLCKGGTNSSSNLIPVCNECHKKIHPFMQ